MVILKCKMCGGDLNVEPGSTVCECEYCGTKQTVPNTDDEKKLKLYERANRLRLRSEFDKAAGVYESLIEEYPEEAEAYWGNLLCKYGIEYVDDPATGDKIPTCHRSSFDCFMDDPDFELVMENSDSVSRKIYREQAKEIEEIRKGIIDVSGKEQPYDIFICYKESDDNGDRTLDSVLAQDIYEALVEKGYRVFFSRISLEDKLGVEYEPYIFAALNSAKVMLAIGTNYDYYNAVWVKNEWSRFLKLMAKDKKKYLIPCYKDIDAYDMPKEFTKLQAQDMGKVGSTQDLLRGIEKLLGTQKMTEMVSSASQNELYVPGSVNTNTLLLRGKMALEDHDWNKADEFFEEILNRDPKSADAYLGKFLAAHHSSTLEQYTKNLKEKYDNCTMVESIACPADDEHIDEIVKNYYIKRFFESETIKKFYDIPRTFNAQLPDRLRKKADLKNEMNDRLLYRVNQFISDDMKTHIESCFKEIVQILDTRIEEAKIHDEAEKERVISEYKEAIKKADEKVDEAYRSFPSPWKMELLDEISRISLFESAVQINDYVQKKYGVHIDENCKKKMDELSLLDQWYGKKKDQMILLLKKIASDHN